ncbi:MAG: PH domain-containing protein [Clostridia bacterium]|nr:PH domain-containing protein [Clostridia bacterium]
MSFDVNKFIWADRKRILGLPITFTRYALSDDRIFVETGLFNIKDDEALLYRIRDISMSRTLFQRMLGLGTITLASTDLSLPVIVFKNIRYPEEVKEIVHEGVEKAKIERRVHIGEFSTFGMDHEMEEFDEARYNQP